MHPPSRLASTLLPLGFLGALITGCNRIPGDVEEARAFYIARFQPPIVAEAARAQPLGGSWSLEANTRLVGLATMQPLVPGFDGRGHLLASWNPHPADAAGRPWLGPYSAPIIVFTGGLDTATHISECSSAVFRQASAWTHYPDQTHAWDTANRGPMRPAADGVCSQALNTLNRLRICRSDRTTADMRARIIAFLNGL